MGSGWVARLIQSLRMSLQIAIFADILKKNCQHGFFNKFMGLTKNMKTSIGLARDLLQPSLMALKTA